MSKKKSSKAKNQTHSPVINCWSPSLGMSDATWPNKQGGKTSAEQPGKQADTKKQKLRILPALHGQNIDCCVGPFPCLLLQL